MKSSTATGTTATAEAGLPRYRGRFAPSPTGLLHLGSLVAALASWLDARAHGGHWLVRMEDLDRARNVPGADTAMLRALDACGLHADEPVLYQSTREPAYTAALHRLAGSGLAYRCSCSRSDAPGVYSGRCRTLPAGPGAAAWRFRLPDRDVIEFDDLIQGHCRFTAAQLGDPVIVRRDGIAAYQLAVVVDDAFQGITHVVRGADLLDSTAWQLRIAQALGLPPLHYAHVPLITEPDGTKLAKSRRSLPVEALQPSAAIGEALALLGLPVIQELKAAPVSDMLHWAVQHWSLARMAGLRAVPLRD